MWCRNLLITLAFWLLSAHFLRDNQLLWVTLFALAPIGLVFKSIPAVRTLQALLFVSVFAVWGTSTIDMVQIRLAHGEPWLRMMLIMSGVMLFSLLAAFLGNGLIQKYQENK